MRIKRISYAFLSFLIVAQSVLLGATPKISFAEETIFEQPRLIISAVQITGGIGKTHEDYIELYNPTGQSFDLNGLRLVKRTAAGITDSTIKAWDEETVIEPYHFYLWGNINFNAISVLPDSTSSATLADNNGIAVRSGSNDSGSIIDSVAWGSTANGFEAKSPENPSVNQSLVRTNLFSEISDFNIQSSDPRNSHDSLMPPVSNEPQENPLPSEEESIEEDLPVEDEGNVEESPPQEEPAESEEINIKITELLPNPSGSDSGTEKIELHNRGTQTVNLEGYKLDDVADNEGLSSNAYVLPDVEIAANEYVSTLIPLGKFAMNNTDGDIVSLFSPDNEILDTVLYEGTTPEAKSYSYYSSGWEWSDSTFGIANGNPPEPVDDKEDSTEDKEETADGEVYDNSGLEITEIFPQPLSGESEFIEIYNAGEETARLSQVNIYVGERKKLLPEYDLEPGKYFVIEQVALPVQLRNSGQVIKLQQAETIISIVTYPLL